MSSNYTIYYTLNGTTPSTSSARYTGPFLLSSNATVKARSYGGGNAGSCNPHAGCSIIYNYYSGIATSDFIVITEASAPSILPNGGMHSENVSISLATSTPGATIHYTTDGSTPTSSSQEYIDGQPFMLAQSSVVKSIASKSTLNDSEISTAIFNIQNNGSGNGSGGIGGNASPGQSDTVSTTPGDFSVTSSGAAMYSIPIAVAEGTAGVQPNIALEYTSQGRNGLMGVGWSITGLSNIHRCPTNIVKDGFIDGIDYDDNDRFCLDGQPLIAVDSSGNKLHPQEPAYGAHETEYRTELNNFSRIISTNSTGNGPESFTVWTKSGEIMQYGVTSDSRINLPRRLPDGTVQIQDDAICWLLNKVSDTVGNYMDIEYFEDEVTGENYPFKIDYTGNTSAGTSPFAAIEFFYEDRDDIGKRYLGGLEMASTKRLKTISSKNNGGLVKEYHLNYRAGSFTDRSHLSEVQECNSNGTCLQPTQFEWNDEETSFSAEAATGVNTRIEYRPYYTDTSFNSFQLNDFNNDGFTDVLYFEGIDTTATGDVYLGDGTGGFAGTAISGSSPINSNLSVYVSQKNGSTQGAYVFKPGDFNGDGITDMYRIDGTSVGGSKFNSIYLGNGDGTFQAKVDGKVPHRAPFTINIGCGMTCTTGTTTTVYKTYTANHRRTHLVDVDGDGKTDVLHIGGGVKFYKSNGDGSLADPINTNINISSGVDSLEFNFGRYHIGEFNGDGLPDMYHVRGTTTTQQDYVYLNNGDGTFETVASGRNSNIDTTKTYRATIALSRYKFADLNNDGLTDTYYVRGHWGSAQDYVYLSQGDGTFTAPISTHFSTYVAPYDNSSTEPSLHWMNRINFGDFDGDGTTDMYYINGVGSAAEDTIYYGQGDGTFGPASAGSDLYVAAYNGDPKYNWSHVDVSKANFVDLNGDGITDIYRMEGQANALPDKVRINQGKRAFISKVTNGLGVEIEINYSPLTDSNVYTKGNCVGNSCNPTLDLIGPLYVVQETKTDTGIGGPKNVLTYEYEEAKVHVQGHGMLGFARRTVVDFETNISVGTKYRQDFPYIGQVDASITCLNATSINYVNNDCDGGQRLSLETNHYPVLTNPTGPIFVYAEKTIGESFDLVSTQLLSTVTTDYVYDNYGNPTQISVSTNDEGIGLYKTITDNTYSTSNFTIGGLFPSGTTGEHLGRLMSTMVTKEAPGQSDEIRNSIFDYDTSNGLLNMETIEPGPDELIKVYTHDNFGNRVTVTESGSGITSRTTTTVYDAQGQFPISVTNALGHTEDRTTYDAFGNVGKLTGPNQLDTNWGYDLQGRKKQEIRADGTETAITYEFCNGSNCPSQISSVVSYKMETTTMGAPTSTQYYDRVNRVILSEIQSFDGTSVFVQTEYDAQGRVARKSNPYFGNTAQYWTDYSYDDLNRLVSESSPTTGTTSYAYNGFVVTVTNDKNQITKEFSNSLDQTLWAEDDNGNQVTFEYDASGNLITVTDSASNITSNTYDVRGFKIAMIDPDMGNWSYSYNVLGELISQTDAKSQTVSMTYDKLGRLKTRTEPETAPSVSTTWIYDTATKGVGKLASVSHYGGYSRTHTYNDDGKPSSTTTVIGGTSYSTSTTYDLFGNVDEITYPSGFKVDHGYNDYGFLDKVRNANNTTEEYYTALAADQFGNITAQTMGHGAGAITSFRSFKQNSGRLQHIDSVVQDLEYAFDSLGNLSQRKENGSSSRTENFTYDNLNRLTSADVVGAGTKTFTYDDLGNITYKSDVGNYTYGAGNAGPHAVTSTSGVLNNTYTYDANGNQISGDGKTTTWSSFNKPVLIQKGSSSSAFTYGPDRARYLQNTVENSVTTHYHLHWWAV